MPRYSHYSRRSFLHQAAWLGAGLALLPACQSTSGRIASAFPVATPESQGVYSRVILNFIQAIERTDFDWHSFMLLRHGKRIAAGWWHPFAPQYKHTLYSLSKSFTSTAVGFAVEEQLVSLNDPVVSFFPQQVSSGANEFLQQMQIRHLLTMTTGHETDSFQPILQQYGQPWVPAFFAHPVKYAPGSTFLYDTGASFMLSAILQEVTGKTLSEYLAPRLFDPLGINQFDWITSPEGYQAGGFGLRLNTEAIARFGQFYLQQGRWQDRQLLSSDWIKAATSKQTETNPGDCEWCQGYGYQFWRCSPPEVYRGDGAYGQFCIVLPPYDAVLVVTSESWDMARSMELIFELLLPAFSDHQLEEAPDAHQQLQDKLQSLTLSVANGFRHSPIQEDLHGQSWELGDNPFGVTHMRLDFNRNDLTWVCSGAGFKQQLTAGWEAWHTNDPEVRNLFPVFFRTDDSSRIAATATWAEPDLLQLDMRFVEAIHGDQILMRFRDDTVELSFLNSVAAHDTSERNRERRQPIVGRRKN